MLDRAREQPYLPHNPFSIESVMRIDVHLDHSLQDTKARSMGIIRRVLHLARHQSVHRRLLMP
jgi:hypothetical protein